MFAHRRKAEAYEDFPVETPPESQASRQEVGVIIFLDYDGVLHPDEVYWYRQKGIVLRTDKLPVEYADTKLFCWAPVLDLALADFPLVRIVLSTSWVPEVGFGKAVKRLPALLQKRVIGATYHSQYTPEWRLLPRFSQILGHVNRHRMDQSWIAIDNDAIGWPEEQLDRLVLTDDYAGLGSPGAQEDLIRKLTELCQRGDSA